MFISRSAYDTGHPKAQTDDLRIAARAVCMARPGIRVVLYHAMPYEGRVRFNPITEAP